MCRLRRAAAGGTDPAGTLTSGLQNCQKVNFPCEGIVLQPPWQAHVPCGGGDAVNQALTVLQGSALISYKEG